MTPLQAALLGARQIGFTVISISVSLLAAFIPLLFMSGIMGRLLREFSMTLAFAVIISTVVSLSVTPMICARFIKTTIDPARDAVRPRHGSHHGRSSRAPTASACASRWSGAR